MVTRAVNKEGARDIANLEAKSTERASFFCKECFRRMPLDAYRERGHLCAVCEFETRCDHQYQMSTLDSTGPNTLVSWECVYCGHRAPIKGITKDGDAGSDAELAEKILAEMADPGIHLHSDDFISPAQKANSSNAKAYRMQVLLEEAPVPTCAEASTARAHDFFDAYAKWMDRARRELSNE